jgi:hypothetical protein
MREMLIQVEYTSGGLEVLSAKAADSNAELQLVEHINGH